MATQNDLKAIIECLKITYTSSDMKLRLQAEEKLSLFEANIVVYTKLLIQTVTADKTIDSKTKLAIVLQLKRVVAKYISTQSSINKIDVIEVIKAFSEALLNPCLENKITQNLLEIFKSLLGFLEEDPQILTQFSIYLCQSLTNKTSLYNSFQGILAIFTSIILCSSFTKQNEFEILTQIMPFTKKMLQVTYENLQVTTDISIDKVKFMDYNKTIGDIYGLYFSYSFKLKSKTSNDSKTFIDKEFEEVIALGIKLLFAVIPNYSPHPPICWSTDSEIDSNVNRMKTQILRFICSITNNLPDTISNQTMFALHMEMTKRIAMNLEYIVLNKYQDLHFMNKSKDNKYSLFISQMILYINKTLSKKTIRNEFKQFELNFFKNIILPFLVITQVEIDESKSEPADYSIILEDAMFNHTSKTIKSSTCQLLQTFITSSCEGFISLYMMQLSESVFADNTTSTSCNNHLLSVDDFILKINLNKEMLLDLCLLVFSILKGLFHNNQIEIDFCIQMNERINILFSPNANDYIKHKICIVLSQYFNVFQSIDDDSNAIAISCIRYLFDNIFLKDNPLVSEEASQSLNKIIEKSKSIYKLHRPLINHLFAEIIKIIPKTMIINVFDVIYQIRSNTEQIELDLQLFTSLCYRISTEAAQKTRLKFIVKQSVPDNIDELEEGQRKKSKSIKTNHELYITKCFNIVRYLMNNESFVISNLKEIESNLKPFIYYMKNPTNIDFDEDIILIMINIIKFTKSIPSIGYELLPELHKYALKNKGMLNDLFELINLYLMIGSSIIEHKEQYCKAILDVFKYGANDEKFNESPFYVALLIHLWLLISKDIPSQVVMELLMSAINNITTIYSWVNDVFKKPELSEAKYSFIGWLMVIYTSMINYPSIAISLLAKSNQLPQLLLWTEYCITLEAITYPIKVLVLALAKIINTEYFINDNGQFINFGLRLLSNQQLYESNKLKNSDKQKLFKKYAYAEDSEEDNKDNEDNGLDDDSKDIENQLNVEAELEELINNSINPYKKTDEFREFRFAMETFKNGHPQQFNQWFSALSDYDKETMNKILLTVRIDLSNQTDTISIPRKIIKIKRNNV